MGPSLCFLGHEFPSQHYQEEDDGVLSGSPNIVVSHDGDEGGVEVDGIFDFLVGKVKIL